MKLPVFTVIIDTFNRPALLKQAVNALFRQTYPHLEIILVNNAATPETVEYLRYVSARDSRVKLVHFTENQFSWDDPLKLVNCYNAGLEVATGDYVWYQSDDDMIADDYAEKMVALFRDNPECITAAGLPLPIDVNGNVLSDYKTRTKNLRPRYMKGHLLALDALRGGRMFSAPGTIFTIKRDVLNKAGGYHPCMEDSHLYGIAPFGVTGFDETAFFYWRRHEGQLNQILILNGNVFARYTHSLLRDWHIEEKWQVFGRYTAREVVSTLWKKALIGPAQWFYINISFFRIQAAFRIFRTLKRYPYFWYLLFVLPVRNPSILTVQPVKRIARVIARRAVKYFPGLVRLSPRLERLSKETSH
jgi:glycosyltransferase involved in cell wall biosynthesis